MNSHEITASQIQKIAFRILCDIDEYCQENNIIYFLSGGSCLGAVRHHGFIPWDDDIDIMLPRDDYERFLKGFSSSFSNKYQVGSLYTDSEWKRPASKIWDINTVLTQKKSDERKMGIFVDVFPIDGLPDNCFLRWLLYRRIQFANIVRNASIRKGFYSYEHFRTLKKLLGKFVRKMDPIKIALKMDNIAKATCYSISNKAGAVLATHYWDRETMDKVVFSHEIRVEFEGKMLPIPVGFETYLHSLYGNYMTIPKEYKEKGYTHLYRWDISINEDK